MRYELTGSTMQALTIKLEPGETVFTESGAMAWMTDSIDMESNFRGGLFGTIGRMFTGESLALITFTAERKPGEVTFAPHVPGKVIDLMITPGTSLIVQKHSFIAAQEGVELKAHFNRRLFGSLFGGEGFILQKVTGSGMAFFEIDGEVVVKDLAPGEVIKVSTSHVAMFEESVAFDITTVKGIKNWIFGGEGLFLTTLRGPGRVWLQTLPFSSLVGQIAAALPNPSGARGGGGNLLSNVLDRE